jgi:hypothetical protein
MKNQDFTVTFTVSQSPEEVFAAIINPHTWWTGEFEGTSDKLGAEFIYRYEPHHYSKQKVSEWIPGKKVVWDVIESQLNFVKDKGEWTGTKIIFDIAKKGDKTEVRFTHSGLVPEFECYDACSNAWSGLVKNSLRDLITTGVSKSLLKPLPTPKNQNFTTAFTVEQTSEKVFAAINNVRGWWSEEIEGITDKNAEEWDYHYKDVHRAKMKITEFIHGKKVVWNVLENYFNFTKDKREWIGNKIIFEVFPKGNITEIRFTQEGLVPEYECFDICSTAWSSYINGSLRSLITTGIGMPNPKEAKLK